ncbi:hypothetical protein GHT06_018297 [Daphnia sinensis]|uniref:Uncharacterized protein n=1 Tax=Daphnia sinensis TaxID=1820382 RepID=A0AAD5PQ18_9CRUS|nr:hypothetical protein GHT06_018297 [Daphnia sinensis]
MHTYSIYTNRDVPVCGSTTIVFGKKNAKKKRKMGASKRQLNRNNKKKISPQLMCVDGGEGRRAKWMNVKIVSKRRAGTVRGWAWEQLMQNSKNVAWMLYTVYRLRQSTL